MGCGRMAKVHLVGVAATCYPHDLLHVPRHGDGGFPAPPPPPRSARGKRNKK